MCDEPRAYSFDSMASNSMKSPNPNSGCREVDVAKTLDCFSVDPTKNQGGIAIVQPTMVLNDMGGSVMNVSEDITSTLRAQDHGHPPLVVAGFKPRQGSAARTLGYEEEMAPTINTDENYAVLQAAGFSYGQSAQARSLGYQEEVSPTLRGGEGGNQKPCVVTAVPIENHPNDSRAKLCEDGICQTLSSRMGTGGNNTPLVLEEVCYGLDQQGGKSGANYTVDVAPPILSDSHGTPHAVAVSEQPVLCIGNGQADIASHITEEVSQTLNCMHDAMAVCIGNGQTKNNYMSEVSNTLDTMHDQQAVMTAVDCRNGTENENVNGTLQAKEQGQNLNSNNVCRKGNTVRRLTPLECERLQNFPDFWTNIGEWVDSTGKLHKDADTPRYKALGNSIALPFWDWLLGRISAQYDYTPTLGSLFDGIGGFPLCWEHHNGKGTALWASEIEEFPIAVTKLRFPEEEKYD